VGLASAYLPAYALDQGAVLFQAGSAVLELVNRLIVFILHLSYWIGSPKSVSKLVQLPAERPPELFCDHFITSHARR
jgi:hypothetical protein